MTNVVAAKLTHLSRRFRVEPCGDGRIRLHVGDERNQEWRARRLVIRGVALAVPALLVGAQMPPPDAAVQWLAAASLGALLVAYGLVREMPSRVLFDGPMVGMVRTSLEIATDGEGGYRGRRDTTTVSVDGAPIAAIGRGDPDPTLLRVLRVGTEVFVVTPDRATFVDHFRDPHDAMDFVYYLAMAMGVPCEERGVVPVERGLPWELPRSRARERRPYGSGGQGIFALLVLGAAVAFPVSHVLAPAKTAMEFGLRCAAYVVFDYVLQDISFRRWVTRAVMATLQEAFGWPPK